MKSIWPKIIAAVVCVALGWTGNNIYHAAKYQEAMEVAERLKVTVNLKEAELAQVRQQTKEEIATLRGMVTSSVGIISGLEEERDAFQETSEAQTEEIRELRTAEVVELLERYPALKAYDLAKDRLIETKDKIILNLSTQSAEKDKIIALKDLEIEKQIKIGLTWKEQYEGQVRLTAAIELAFKNYRKGGGNGLLWFAGGFASGVVGTVLAH